VKDSSVYYKALELLQGINMNKEKLMGEKQWEKWGNGPIVSELDNIHILRRTYFQSLNDEEFSILLH
jgi:hypothetical protein